MRNTILGMLVRSGDSFISGEEMSRISGISRAAVWKHIESLKKEGYEIESVTKKGYRLTNANGKMETAFYSLPEKCRIGKNHIYLDEVGSTNTYAKTVADKMPDGTVILADRQTAGRGRRGRQWDSSAGRGIWMSVILKPGIQMAEAIMMTHMAGAAVCDALCGLGYDAGIKWPNDIVVSGRKVCGILAELDGEPEMLHHVVVGIGVNVNHLPEEFPEDIRDRATSLRIVSGHEVAREKLLAQIIQRLDHYYGFVEQHQTEEIIAFCRRKSVTLGSEIRVLSGDDILVGKAMALTDTGGLIVEDMTGQTTEIISGEVSVRGICGYV